MKLLMMYKIGLRGEIMLNSRVKRIFLIICCLIILFFGILNLFEHNFIRGIIKIAIASIMLIIFTDKNINI